MLGLPPFVAFANALIRVFLAACWYDEKTAVVSVVSAEPPFSVPITKMADESKTKATIKAVITIT
jgi:hypothetical protein